MSRLSSKKHSPAQVFAQFTSAGENQDTSVAKTECKHEEASNNRREIQITESGEVSLPPDKARVSIVCTNAKVSRHFFIISYLSLVKEEEERINCAGSGQYRVNDCFGSTLFVSNNEIKKIRFSDLCSELVLIKK